MKFQKCQKNCKNVKNWVNRKKKWAGKKNKNNARYGKKMRKQCTFFGGNQKKHKMHKKNALKCKTHPPHMTEFQTLTPILTLEPKKSKSGHETKKRSWSKKTDARFTTGPPGGVVGPFRERGGGQERKLRHTQRLWPTGDRKEATPLHTQPAGCHRIGVNKKACGEGAEFAWCVTLSDLIKFCSGSETFSNQQCQKPSNVLRQR